ncbi:N-(5'-phosphoribosyl)anthranilate isomerase [Yoonia maricola]|nr:N-(5'-phosphoribosyl)anthranilate isomerase [Yoonia maricola]
MSPETWFRHLFSAQSARDGGVVRRKVRDMERMVGRDVFTAEIRRRGYSAVENAGQVIVFCNAEPVRVVVG